MADAARELEPALVVVCSVLCSRFRRAESSLLEIARRHRLAVAGAGASQSLADSLNGSWISEGPVAAAQRLA